MSFRDPAGFVSDSGQEIRRHLTPDGARVMTALRQSGVLEPLMREGLVIQTEWLSEHELSHRRIAFPSYPFEWAPEMLHAAASLTLDVAERIGPAGWELKDASPFNVLFDGSRPVFVDVGSLQPREPGATLWLPFAQFVRTFILPLRLNASHGLSLRRAFEGAREGVSPEEAARMLSPRQRWLSGYLTLATIPALLGGKAPAQRGAPTRASDPERAAHVRRGLMRHLRSAVHSAAPSAARRSNWTGYTSQGPHTAAYHEQRRALVVELLGAAPRRVLDVGCNDAHVSLHLASLGHSVVAIDRDETVIGAAYREAARVGADVLPLVLDFAAPPGGTGWRNAETIAFLDRARGHFDAVLLLAVMHHLMVGAGIPLASLLAQVAEVTSHAAVIEFIPNDDNQFVEVARGRDALYSSYSAEEFERVATQFFRIERRAPLDNTGRVLYLLIKS